MEACLMKCSTGSDMLRAFRPFAFPRSHFGHLRTSAVSFRTGTFPLKQFVVEARGNARIESPKIRNRRIRKKFNGTSTKPRLSVFSSDKHLYAMLVDDQNKKCLFYGSTLQIKIRGDPPCSTIEAAKRVGEELIKASIELNIDEISCYDRNGNARGERMQAFEVAIAQHGFLPN